MKIAEIYRSIQGEGLLTGVPSVFLRVSGCNLRCWYCDTPFTSWHPEGSDMAVDEVIAQVEEWDCRHVVVTGGEPMLFAELIPLCEQLRSRGRHLTIETSGTLYLPVACDLMSVSPKLSSSAPSAEDHPHWNRRHGRERLRLSVLFRLLEEYECQLKFVIDTPADLDELEILLDELPYVDPESVLLMPQGTDPIELENRQTWLKPYCLQHEFVFCPRKQIEWFGQVRGT